MQKSRKEALDEFLGFVGELDDDVARTVAEGLLSRAVEIVWQKHPWLDFQSPAPLECTLVSGQRSYPLPEFFGRLGKKKVRNLTRGTPLEPIEDDEAQACYPRAGTSLEQGGTPTRFQIAGTVGVMRQPLVTGESLQVVSTSAADAGVDGPVASIEGADSNGNERRLQVALSGTTPVTIGTWSWIDNYAKAYPAGVEPPTAYTSSAGAVTLAVVPSGQALQTLFPEESARAHRILTFFPKPNVTDVIAIPVMRRPHRLINDADVLPNDWWNAIFEEMHIQYRVNTGELSVDSVVPRPHLIDLLALDNVNRGPRHIRPFGAARP